MLYESGYNSNLIFDPEEYFHVTCDHTMHNQKF